MSYTNYALINASRKIKKEVAIEVEKKNPEYDLYVFKILKESEKAIRLEVAPESTFTAYNLDGEKGEYKSAPLEVWMAKSLLYSDPVVGKPLDCVNWKLTDINMAFIEILWAQMQ